MEKGNNTSPLSSAYFSHVSFFEPSPVLPVFGSQSSVQFLDDAGRGQQRVHVAQVWGACRCGYPAPQRVFGKSEVPGKGCRSRACLVCQV